ncbi:MAG TPA: LytTR family DNA-binding domain-containing protein [Terriglobales bacterium]|jgi:two-component system LytT family response regulator|nr:LytTR family DNA-binding domain-containing protein [Terriglobales bacterium]
MSSESPPARIRALVVDDEPLARSNIVHLLRANPQVEILGECDSSTAALDAIRTQKPDLVFLDVRMPEYDGFDILEMLGAEAPPAVILVTAYDQYALKAFDTGALDYLLKPFNNARFERALERARERITQRRRVPAKMDRLTIKNAGSVTFIPAGEIDWIEAADYYASLHVGAKTHLLRRSMNDLESDLDPAQFCRIHRSTIVNLDRVRELRFDSDAEYELLLADGTKLRLSRRYRKDLQGRLGQAVDVKVPL